MIPPLDPRIDSAVAWRRLAVSLVLMTIGSSGMYTVSVVLHPEVTIKVTINVARSVEEAELQASGKSIQELAAEADAAADFEIANLFDDIGGAASEDA